MAKKLLSKIFLSFVFLGLLTMPVFVNASGSAPTPQTLPNSAQQAQIESQLGGNACKIWAEGSFSMCALSMFYNFILMGSFWLVEIAGKIFDYFIFFALNTNSYTSEFITKGWGVVRDIANVAFIFTLLYLAIRHILGNSAKKAIPTLLIVALLINFSLFFTKVVIDAGNILARAFVNSINIENDAYADVVGYKSISVGIVSKINPQNMLDKQLFQPGIGGQTGTMQTTGGISEGSLATDIDSVKGYFFLVFLMLTIVNLALAWVFLSVALLFIGRIIGLWFTMIFAPVAFITLAVPGSGGLVKQMSFDSWKDNLLKLAFMPAIFIFFLYLTIMFMATIFSIDPTVNAGDTAMYMLKTLIPFLFVIFLLNIAKKTATDMAGEIGGMVKSVVGKIAGVTAGLALGVTAFAGRKVIGCIASSTLRGGNYNKRIAEKRRALRDPNLAVQDRVKLKAQLEALKATKSSLSKLKQSSFDIRNAGKAKGLVGATARGVGFGLGAGMTAFGGKGFNAGKGSDQSRAKYEDEQKKKALKMAEDQSSVSYRERDAVVRNQRQMVQQEIDEIKAGRVTLEKGFDDQTNEIVKKLDELKAKPPGDFTDEDFKNYDELTDRMENLKNGKIEALKKFDEINNAKIKEKEKIIKDDSKLIDKEVNERRGLAADSVEGRDIWGMYHGVDNKEIADDIRKGKSSKSDEEKALELIEKLQKKKDGEKSKPEPKDDGDEKKS